jgi:hypothetical protein
MSITPWSLPSEWLMIIGMLIALAMLVFVLLVVIRDRAITRRELARVQQQLSLALLQNEEFRATAASQAHAFRRETTFPERGIFGSGEARQSSQPTVPVFGGFSPNTQPVEARDPHSTSVSFPENLSALDARDDHPQSADRPFSTDVVRALFSQWCRSGEPPSQTEMVEIVPLRLASSRHAHELAEPVHYFEDGEQIGDFVRFSPRGEDSGFVFPHPRARPNKDILRILFQDQVDEFLHNRERLADVEPVRMRKRGEHWEKDT